MVVISVPVLKCHARNFKSANFKNCTTMWERKSENDSKCFLYIFAKTAYTFMSITPGREPMRCSMDWTQEPQVIPSTPRETEHRLPFCVMIASSKKTQEWQSVFILTYNCKSLVLKQQIEKASKHQSKWGKRESLSKCKINKACY